MVTEDNDLVTERRAGFFYTLAALFRVQQLEWTDYCGLSCHIMTPYIDFSRGMGTTSTARNTSIRVGGANEFTPECIQYSATMEKTI